MGLIDSLIQFIAGTPADAEDVNSNFDNIRSEVNGNLDDDNIKTAAAILQSKIDSTVPWLTALKIKDADSATTLEAAKATNANLGAAGEADHVVGTDSAGLFPPAASIFAAEDSDDSALSLQTAYRVAGGLHVATSTGYETVTTGLTAITFALVTAYGHAATVLYTYSAGNISIYCTDTRGYNWIAIGTV